MVGFVGVGLLLTASAAPIPTVPPTQPPSVHDRDQAAQFAYLVQNAAQTVGQSYNWPDGNLTNDQKMKEMIAAAIRGMYEEAERPLPDDLLRTLRAADHSDILTVLIDARLRLVDVPTLHGPRALFAAMNGFRHATDPYCGLMNPRASSFVSVDMDFGVGIELDGVTGQRWGIYRVERGMATGQLPAVGVIGPKLKADEVPSPTGFPWRVRRIISGSPAQRAGIKAGDILTHVNGTEITAENANRQFPAFAFPPPVGFDPNTGQPLPFKRVLKFRRAGATDAIAVTLEANSYTPESVFGVIRTADGGWDCLLDRERKIGYIRLGPIEDGADVRFATLLDDLTRQGCRGLILDLRWCPGGYVVPGTRIAGMLLKPGMVIAELQTRSNGNFAAPGLPHVEYYRAPAAPLGGKFLGPKILVLVGPETTGGGELIAAALRDNGRCAVMGQRTVGRAAIQNIIDAGFGGLQFKVTTGETLRPNGKSRARLPNSKPTDDWGIRPDPGLEVPITLDLSKRLRKWADEHALRPAESQEALPFDDPAQDPARAAALAHLRKLLNPPARTHDTR